jgi:3-methyladenine DNA glycosylase AlkD
MDAIIQKVRLTLRGLADEKVKISGEHFFKETVKLYGVKTPLVIKLGKDIFREIKDREKTEIFALCEELWKSGYMEESFIACGWSHALSKDFKPEDFEVLEHWVSTYVTNWASCDTLCNHTVGSFIEMYPEYLSRLKKWATNKNRWMRRASAVSLIVPARQGKFLQDVFEIADILLHDPDDLVQKGYGWVLKVAGESHQHEVFDYVMKHKATMPRTALRYAIEKMPKNQKEQAMKKI